MAKQDKSKLKGWFSTGQYPTQEQFGDWMDSYIHKDDRLVLKTNFPELDQVLRQKVDQAVFQHHLDDRANPHRVTKAQVGLGKVDNTADADKPVSKAAQAALNTKADKVHTHPVSSLSGFDTDATLAANSDERISSQKAVKTYVDDQIALATTHRAGTTDKPVLQFEPGELLTTPQDGAWEWDGTNLYFTVKGSRKKMLKEPTFSYLDSQHLDVNPREALTNSVEIAIPANVFKNDGVTNLYALLWGYWHEGLVSSQSNFSIDVSLLLNIKNGLFSNDRTGTSPFTSLKIVDIKSNKDIYLKEIEMPIASAIQSSEIVTSQWSKLILFGIGQSNESKYPFEIPGIYLRDSANTRAFGASEACFSITATLKLIRKSQEMVLPIDQASYRIQLRHFTLNTLA